MLALRKTEAAERTVRLLVRLGLAQWAQAHGI